MDRGAQLETSLVMLNGLCWAEASTHGGKESNCSQSELGGNFFPPGKIEQISESRG